MAVRVAENLEFDMARTRQVFLDVHVAVAERGQRLRTRELEGATEVVWVPRDAHPLTAAARGCLDDDGEADVACEALTPHPRLPPAPGCPG